MDRSRALTLYGLLLCLGLGCVSPVRADARLCAAPGSDGSVELSGVINRYFAAPGVSLTAGQREIPLGETRGEGALREGDLLLLWQVQGATLQSTNDESYGVAGLSAGHFEWLRLDTVLDEGRIRVTGAGPRAGLLHDYPFHDPPGESRALAQPVAGRARWQLIRVPQFEQAVLAGDVHALPWNGASGGALALDVRGRLTLAGHALDARGAGFRGGAALALSGALGSETDWRYPAPDSEELAAGYGQHGGKGEGVVGTPRWVLVDGRQQRTTEEEGRGTSDGYPGGSRARGAPGNAGGGGNSPAGAGGGGAGTEAGQPGAGLGGQGGHALPVGLWPGGGGGAGSVAGEGPAEAGGGAGGGVVLVRAGQLAEAPGRLDMRGQPGMAGETGGGGGGAGMIALESEQPLPKTWHLQIGGGVAGSGRLAGGRGGDGQLWTQAGNGVAAGFVCAPTGTHLRGRVTRVLGDQAPQPLAGWPVTVDAPEGTLVATDTDEAGEFALRVPAAHAGQAVRVGVQPPEGWRIDSVLPAALADTTGWRLVVEEEQRHQLVLTALRLGELLPPPGRVVETGATELLLFRYRAGLDGRVRFRYPASAPDWRPALLLDPGCMGVTLYQDETLSRWLPAQADSTVCVRLRVQVPTGGRAATYTLPLEAEFEAGGRAPVLERAEVLLQQAP